MMDALTRLSQQGFSFRAFPAYPRHVGVEKYNCVALLELASEGRWKQFGSAGYLIDGQIGLLVERQGRPTFVHKSKKLPAEGDRMKDFQQFQREL